MIDWLSAGLQQHQLASSSLKALASVLIHVCVREPHLQSVQTARCAGLFCLPAFTCCCVCLQAGLSGLSFDEGNFGVFGYVTTGMDNVVKLQTGDVIRSAKLVAGKERLVVPPQQQQADAGSS